MYSLVPFYVQRGRKQTEKKISYVFEEKNVYQGVEIYAAAYTSTKILSLNFLGAWIFIRKPFALHLPLRR